MTPTTRNTPGNTYRAILILAGLAASEQDYVLEQILTMEELLEVYKQDGIHQELNDKT